MVLLALHTNCPHLLAVAIQHSRPWKPDWFLLTTGTLASCLHMKLGRCSHLPVFFAEQFRPFHLKKRRSHGDRFKTETFHGRKQETEPGLFSGNPLGMEKNSIHTAAVLTAGQPSTSGRGPMNAILRGIDDGRILSDPATGESSSRDRKAL